MPEGSIRDIDETEGLELLGLARVGRIAWMNGEGELQLVLINYAFDDNRIYFRTTEESELAELAVPTPVVVEADYLEELYQTGWSVTVNGTTAAVSESEASKLQLQPTPWAPGDRSFYVSVCIEKIGGRKVRGAM